MSDYRAVPVTEAKRIAGQYAKAQVVILAWDPEAMLTHVTTYGEQAVDKEYAAAAGEICAKALGCDLGKKQVFEVFHSDYSPALFKEAVDLLNLIHCRQGTSPVMLQTVERFLRQCGRGHRAG